MYTCEAGPGREQGVGKKGDWGSTSISELIDCYELTKKSEKAVGEVAEAGKNGARQRPFHAGEAESSGTGTDFNGMGVPEYLGNSHFGRSQGRRPDGSGQRSVWEERKWKWDMESSFIQGLGSSGLSTARGEVKQGRQRDLVTGREGHGLLNKHHG